MLKHPRFNKLLINMQPYSFVGLILMLHVFFHYHLILYMIMHLINIKAFVYFTNIYYSVFSLYLPIMIPSTHMLGGHHDHLIQHFKYFFIMLICFIMKFLQWWCIISLILLFHNDSQLFGFGLHPINMLLQVPWNAGVNHLIQRLAFLDGHHLLFIVMVSILFVLVSQ